VKIISEGALVRSGPYENGSNFGVEEGPTRQMDRRIRVLVMGTELDAVKANPGYASLVYGRVWRR